MFELRSALSVFRGFMVAACLALLTGCGPSSLTPLAAVPANLTATAGNAVVTLAWTASSGATSYNVKRATTSGGPYTQLAAPTSTGFADSAVTNGTAYYYVVTALNAGGESANSAQVTATPAAPPTAPPAAPANLTATAGNAAIILTWSASSGATGYNVKRATSSGGPFTQLAAATSTGYTDSAVTNGTTYYYVVSALNAGGESVNSAQASATPTASPPPAAPAAPTNLTGTPGNAQVGLTWSASSGATGYHVKRGTTSGGPYTQIAAVSTTSYTDTPLTNGTTYYYVVSALNSSVESANSAQVSVIPAAPAPPPTNLGTWINVTPTGVDLTDSLCGNYGSQAVQADAMNPGHLYAEFNCQGIWKSVDYGATWTGPINTGTNGATIGSCGSGITVSPSSAGNPPTIYEGCIRGNGLGFSKSVDGGVNWTQITVTPTTRQDYYPPVVDPYDANHLLMPAHEFDSIVESMDGGQTWASVPLANGMLQNGGTGFIFFINTGVASTTRGTWLWLASQSGGSFGTWRTANSGTAWVEVDHNEHPLGAAQIYQPDNNGVVYMAGQSSVLGSGVLRSTNYGQTWVHVGATDQETVVVGTSKNIYSMYGVPVGPGGTTDPAFEIASQPGTGTWVSPGTPSALTQGAAQISVVNNGTNNILVAAMWNSGVWRYVEP
jgi:fibronectin type 3 domain-containing protein